MEMQQEMADDIMDNALGNADDESEDEIVQRVLDEIGVDMASGLKEAPTQQAAQAESQDVSDLEARLQNLRAG